MVQLFSRVRHLPVKDKDFEVTGTFGLLEDSEAASMTPAAQRNNIGLETETAELPNYGGSNELENPELLCRAHNAYRAVQVFGPKYMKQFMTSLR